MACSMPPIYWSTGSQMNRQAALSVGAFAFFGSVKRAKILGRIDKSVHRVGFAPRRRPHYQVSDMLPGWMPVEGISGRIKGNNIRRQIGSLSSAPESTPQTSQ